MKKFDKILINATKHILEDNENPLIKNAINTIKNAVSNNGKLNSNPTAKALASDLFDSPMGDSTDPLHSAFDKIKDNPDNPNLSPKELESFLSLATKLNPSENSSEKDENKPTTPTNTSSTVKPVVQSNTQPNAKQYNPLNASSN
jgi:hypothetical protein